MRPRANTTKEKREGAALGRGAPFITFVAKTVYYATLSQVVGRPLLISLMILSAFGYGGTALAFILDENIRTIVDAETIDAMLMDEKIPQSFYERYLIQNDKGDYIFAPVKQAYVK